MKKEKDTATVRYRVPDSVRRSLQNKSRRDRRFFDNLMILLWCECKAWNTKKSVSIDGWADIELPCYSLEKGAFLDDGLSYNTPRNKLSAREMACLQRFIDTHTFHDLAEACKQISEDLADSCMACALNVLNGIGRRNGEGNGELPHP